MVPCSSSPWLMLLPLLLLLLVLLATQR